jgi:MFS family permease
MRIPDALRPMLEVWSHRNYACFMGGMTPALITLWVQRVGVLWLAWQLTKSNTWVGLVVAVEYAPTIVLAPFVGAYTDRTDPVRQQKITQWFSLVFSALMAGLTYADLMNIWLLLALSLLLGCLQPFNAISRHSIVPNTVPREKIATALATDSALFNAARFVGPALAGMLIEAFGVTSTFAANSFGCVFYLAGLYLMRLEMPDRSGHGHGSMVAAIAEGFAYVRGHAGMGPLFLLLAIGAVWLRPLQDLLPGYAEQVLKLGPAGLGWMTASMGIGATIAATMVAIYGRTTGLSVVVLLAFLVNILATLCFVATNWLFVTLLAGAVWGGSLTMLTTATQALVQSSVDNNLRGRVMALYTMIYRGAPFIGAIVIGWVADRIGLQLAFAIAALLCVLPWLTALRKRGAITLALEGGHNDLDARLVATSKAWAGVGYEVLVDLKERAAPLVGKVRAQTKAMAAKAQEAVRQRGGKDDLK